MPNNKTLKISDKYAYFCSKFYIIIIFTNSIAAVWSNAFLQCLIL